MWPCQVSQPQGHPSVTPQWKWPQGGDMAGLTRLQPRSTRRGSGDRPQWAVGKEGAVSQQVPMRDTGDTLVGP